MDYVGFVNGLLVDCAVVQRGNVRIVPLGVDLSTRLLLFASCVCFCLFVVCVCVCATDSSFTHSLITHSLNYSFTHKTI